jgi:hypothetical protein
MNDVTVLGGGGGQGQKCPNLLDIIYGRPLRRTLFTINAKRDCKML